MTKPTAAAVGRVLKPKGSEPHLHKVIAVRPDGTVRTLLSRQLKPNT